MADTRRLLVVFAHPLSDSLAAAGFEPTICMVPEGEEHKTLATIATLYDAFLAAWISPRFP